MDKRIWIGIAVVGVAVAGIVAWQFFLPEGTDRVDEAQMEGTVVKSGVFKDGDSSHHASGNAAIIQTADGYVLQFEDYEATSGPDVYFYLTEKAEARSTGDVESGLKLLTPGGRDGGEATKRGNFNIPLPDFDPTRWNGITLWCDDFNVVFGTAALTS